MINNLTILNVTIPLIKSLGYIRVQGTEWDRFKNPPVAVAVAVARVSPPFPCAPALALLPIPFFKSCN
jgi:hypothetical protein